MPRENSLMEILVSYIYPVIRRQFQKSLVTNVFKPESVTGQQTGLCVQQCWKVFTGDKEKVSHKHCQNNKLC